MENQRNDFTYRLLVDGGIKKGMRVLDVGCGTGDVSMMVAELIGKSGEIIGFDISENSLVTARNVAKEKQLSNIRFIHADIACLPYDLGNFDAIVGRRVLMYQKDATNSIKGSIAKIHKRHRKFAAGQTEPFSGRILGNTKNLVDQSNFFSYI